ncbi:MAG: MBL fold metallo-hydrolase [Proteobacteria bacterium]|jgi:phosphoribosyl 1,2-cyclic phosphodiesterase|nr:MBL fold metallo-hydrolase [Pseudomonadota bacterium]
MIAISLQSGSNGNCIYVEAGDTRLLVDAGISGKQVERRLASRGRDPRSLSAVLVTHDHIDHVKCAGIYARKWGVPVYLTGKTLAAARGRFDLGRIADVRAFGAGDAFEIGGVRVETIPTPHDGTDGVAYAVEHRGKRLGVLTDLGHPFDGLGALVSDLDGVFLESNHDERMLAEGPYPAYLKRRIRGPHGHISNEEAAALLTAAADLGRLQWACLAHLSAENNTPEVALATSARALDGRIPLAVASREIVSDVFEI